MDSLGFCRNGRRASSNRFNSDYFIQTLLMTPIDSSHSSTANLSDDLVIITEAGRAIVWTEDAVDECLVFKKFLQLFFKLRPAGKDLLRSLLASCFTTFKIPSDDFRYAFVATRRFVNPCQCIHTRTSPSNLASAAAA